ncbi:MAG: hypothetical protein ABI333_05095 [bacterium]
MRRALRIWSLLALSVVLGAAACGDDDGGGGGDGGGGADGGLPDAGQVQPVEGWPEPNEWSWDGSWTPGEGAFPLDGMFDDEYFDGHPDGNGQPTPILPPGEWDWDDGNDDLANWRNFETNLGTFDPLLDGQGRQYGWRLMGNTPDAVDFSGAAAYFEGSSGADIVDLGVGGALHSYGDGNLGDGPDVLVFQQSWALDFRTGSTATGALRDNDLVVAGCGENPDGSFDVETTTIHTGPGRDWVFVRDLSRAAVDLGNGGDGRTDATDGQDGDDLVVLRGNTHDFRVFGGFGNDLAIWFVDDNVQTTTWLGPNFFGGGGHGDALWDDPGVDRLVLAVPDDTTLVTATPTPPGGLLVRATDGELILDDPTQGDVYARYCVECGTGPGGRKTVILEYVSADESIHTGYFYVTAFEQLQVGVGPGARVFLLDDVTGTAVEAPGEDPVIPPDWPTEYCP